MKSLSWSTKLNKFAENSSNSEADNPTRKQFLAYLEWLPPERSSLLISIINSIHQYKLSFTEFSEYKKALAECIHETNEITVLQENELFLKMEKNASELIWDLYKLLWIAKSKFDSISVDPYSSESCQVEDDQNCNGNQNSQKDKVDSPNDLKNEHTSNAALINKHNVIDVKYVLFKHNFKPKDFINIQMQLQILLLWPGQAFAHIYKSFTEMKNIKSYK